MKIIKSTEPKKRGRKPKVSVIKPFNAADIKLFRGSDLKFNDSLFKSIRTNRELDVILSTEGGLMPGTNMIMVGGPGSGKSTVVLDMLADFTRKGFKCLFVSGEMDEIAHYKYCKRLPKFSIVQTLFLRIEIVIKILKCILQYLKIQYITVMKQYQNKFGKLN
jgi:predicted ATP-dependent serine protease